VGPTTVPLSFTDCLEILGSQSPGALRVCQAHDGIALPLFKGVPGKAAGNYESIAGLTFET
jgi:hypothetical protein